MIDVSEIVQSKKSKTYKKDNVRKKKILIKILHMNLKKQNIKVKDFNNTKSLIFIL